MAPEISALTANEEGYTNKVDIWSLGMTALELAYGKNPFITGDHSAVSRWLHNPLELDMKKFLLWAYKPQEKRTNSLSTHFLTLVSSCLRFDPKERPSAEELLKLPFFNKAKDKSYITPEQLQKRSKPMIRNHSSRLVSPIAKVRSLSANFQKSDYGLKRVIPSPDFSLKRISTSFQKENISCDDSEPEIPPQLARLRSHSLPNSL